MEASEGFPPVSRVDAEILILGSLPGRRSLADRQYYANPGNAFWPIMEALFGIRGPYESRLGQLVEKRIALWDVLKSSVRPGSLDARIELDSACANDFCGFLRKHADIRLVAFNGRKAEQLYDRFVDVDALRPDIRRAGLPSTSPAYAAMPFSGKLERWRRAIVAASECQQIRSRQ